MHTAQIAKLLKKNQIQKIEEALRKKHCQDITYEQWLQIEKDVVTNKHKIIDTFKELIPEAITGTFKNRLDEELIHSLDTDFRELAKKININELKKSLPNDQSKNTQNIKAFLDEIEKLKHE